MADDGAENTTRLVLLISSYSFLDHPHCTYIMPHLHFLCLAETSIRLRHPLIRPDSSQSIEQVLRIILVLDLLKLRVIVAIEHALPIRILKIALVHVSVSAARQNLLDARHDLLGEEILGVGHLLERHLEGPGDGDCRGHDGVAPACVDGIVRVSAGGEGGVEADADDLGAQFVHVAEGGDEIVGLVHGDVSGDEGSAVESDALVDMQLVNMNKFFEICKHGRLTTGRGANIVS